MNKTIQSNSFRPYSKSLLETWNDYLDPSKNPQLDENFLVRNLRKCLLDFSTFAADFDTEARQLAAKDPIFISLSGKEKDNFQLWSSEKISKALDIYWAPLSQAATQYTSPAYKNQIKKLVGMEQKIRDSLALLNNMTRASGDASITLDDILLFFDELTLIRLAPYTKTALIGIPFRVTDSQSSEDEIMAGIAHELGHFLYWRLDEFNNLDIKHNQIMEMVNAGLQSKLNENLHRSIRYINAWFEELFADFIGANIAKTSHLETSKKMVIRSNKQSSRSGNNDHEHVSDILRPLVSMYVVNGARDKAMQDWRTFLKDEFPVNPASVMIEIIGESKNQRKISRKADELSQILLDAVDVISDELKNTTNKTLFRPYFSNISKVEMLSTKALRLAKKLSDKNRHEASENGGDQLSVLDVFLEPQIMEAGEQAHPHTVTTPAHSYSFTVYHTHP